LSKAYIHQAFTKTFVKIYSKLHGAIVLIHTVLSTTTIGPNPIKFQDHKSKIEVTGPDFLIFTIAFAI